MALHFLDRATEPLRQELVKASSTFEVLKLRRLSFEVDGENLPRLIFSQKTKVDRLLKETEFTRQMVGLLLHCQRRFEGYEVLFCSSIGSLALLLRLGKTVIRARRTNLHSLRDHSTSPMLCYSSPVSGNYYVRESTRINLGHLDEKVQSSQWMSGFVIE